MSLSLLESQNVQNSLNLNSSNIISYLPNTTVLTAQNPINSQSGSFSSPFGNLSNKTYIFMGIAKIEFLSITTPPAYIGGDIAFRIGTSSISISPFTLPSQSTSYIAVPINAIWNTIGTDGNNPNAYWTLTPNANYTCNSGGGVNLTLSGVMIPIN